MNNLDTSFEDELKLKLKDRNLTQSSINLYIKNLERLNGNLLIKNWKFLNNPKKLFEGLAKRYKENTIRNFLISIVTSLEVSKGNDEILKKLHKRYFDTLLNLNRQLAKKSTFELSDSQKQNWITWKEVEEIHENLRKEALEISKKKVICAKDYYITLQYMVLSLYFYIEPRRNLDYQVMNIIYKFSPSMEENVNYLDFTNNNFIFNVYKTSKKYGEKIVNFNDKMKDAIDLYIKHHPNLQKGKVSKSTNTRFLVHYDGSSLDSINSITLILNKIFGRNIGSSLLRHIYVSNIQKDNIPAIKNMKEIADKMGHSVGMSIDYIKN